MGHSVAVLGASGFAGGELLRLLDGHPGLDVVHIGAHTQRGRPLREVHPQLAGGGRLLGGLEPAEVPDVELAFLALPHGASAAVGAVLAERGSKVVDLGSDYRLDTEARYRLAYEAAHPYPEQLGAWVYGLPELFAQQVASAHRVAAPGCYPTAALLALAPLLKEGLVGDGPLVIDALSGVTGAGRSLREDLLFGAVGEGVRAYAVTVHRHRPEIEMGLQRHTGREWRVTFTPHLVPMQRGILATCTVPLTSGVGGADLLDALRVAYADRPFVEVIEQPPQTRWVAGSNRALLAAFADVHTGTGVVQCALDNLLKGAAGQAVQDANLMLGLDETAGLPLAGWMP